jgi:hypothetical protein
MAVLSFDEITKIINQPDPKWVEAARNNTKKLQVHINGLNVAQYLNQIDNYENNRQFELRQKFATSNKFIFENLLRPVDKVFSASGGGVILKTKTEQSEKTVNEKIQNFAGGYSLRKWIETTQSNKYYSDPSGLIFFEWDQAETKPTFKDIFSIRNYQSDGRKIEWVLFEPFKKLNENGVELPGEYFRFVDSANDYLFHKIDTNVRLIEDETYPNPWGYVPAIINSNIQDSTLNYHISPVDTVIELADHYLRTNSVKNIYEFLHGYPIFWALVEACRRCDGTGLYDGKTCTKCNGEGHTFRKDVSDVLKIKPPQNADQPKLAPDIAGYIQPDLETWREQRTELEWLKTLMYFTLWGTTYERADNETATAAFIDVQPVNDRLNKFADAYEQTELLITDIVGTFYAQGNYEGVSVNYGRRFLVEPPDKVWQKYQDAKAKGAPKVSLDYLLIQFYQSEYKDDLQNLAIAQKGILIEPFIHKTDEEINSLPVMTADKLRKFYFNEWFKSVDKTEILTKDVQTLAQMFDAYMLTKTAEQPKTNETEDEPDNEI